MWRSQTYSIDAGNSVEHQVIFPQTNTIISLPEADLPTFLIAKVTLEIRDLGQWVILCLSIIFIHIVTMTSFWSHNDNILAFLLTNLASCILTLA